VPWNSSKQQRATNESEKKPKIGNEIRIPSFIEDENHSCYEN
jgi:hypothetical protein